MALSALSVGKLASQNQCSKHWGTIQAPSEARSAEGGGVWRGSLQPLPNMWFGA